MILQSIMYYLSFTPLWISILYIEIMSLLHGTENRLTEIGYIISMPIMMLIAIIYTKKVFNSHNVNGVKCELKSAKEQKLITAEFIVTYIMPLMAFDFTTWEGMILFIFFFGVFGWICVRHNYFCTNIILDIMHYRIYNSVVIVDSTSVEVQVLSKENLRVHIGEKMILKWINNDYGYIVCK